MMIQKPRILFITVFAISGFTGLIYESIWTHYLKLFLGHAAYAQSMVLAVFMGGMALGAWIVSESVSRWSNLIRIYAVVEGVIGFLAVIFHETFDLMMVVSFDVVIPEFGASVLVNAYKWLTAIMLIAPQSILLGMTFPLMVGGVIRRFPQEQGKDIAVLYFSNSIGAAAGALISGFFLVEQFGLPGTIMIAGVLNISLAVFVWYLSSIQEPAYIRTEMGFRDKERAWSGAALFLVGAFITGTASFVYEISWVRMLSLVLGSTFHSFELMLSAFITGLALGGLWIKNKIDKIDNPVAFLAYIQIVMAVLAALTLALYNYTFEWVGWLVKYLMETKGGYFSYGLGSHLVAFMVMLPATFCAGMTLPLFAHVLMKSGYGEKSIGSAYSFNTLGSICGALFAVQIGMPLLGVKSLMGVGALLDVFLGFMLLRFSGISATPKRYALPILGGGSILLLVNYVELDPMQMASGVYRRGESRIEGHRVLYHRDGKTATVSVYSYKDIAATIATNGKPDATIVFDPVLGESGDEITMVMLGALPLMMRPDAKNVANIGFGSGLTSHTVLASSAVDRLDTVEIEEFMVEGAQIFMPRVYNAYQDSRSNIHIEDAKTWFSQNNKRFDIIISEPSNPWVSGVSGLFSDEFYRHVRRYMKDDGLFVQWLQLYEFNDKLAASVFSAINDNFRDYEVYSTGESDVIIVASANGEVPSPNGKIFQSPAMNKELAMVGVNGLQDVLVRRVAGKEILQPLFSMLGVRKNSDYFPVLEIQAPRARFYVETASTLPLLGLAPLPIVEMMSNNYEMWDGGKITNDGSSRIENIIRASLVFDVVNEVGNGLSEKTLSTEDRNLVDSVKLCKEDQGTFDGRLHALALNTLPYMESSKLTELWRLGWTECKFPPMQLEVYRAIAARDAKSMLMLSEEQLKIGVDNDIWRHYLFVTALLGAKSLGDDAALNRIWAQYISVIYPDGNIDTYVLAILG